MPQLAITVVGPDRSGIVARVTGLLHDAEATLIDTAMTILGGQFAILALLHAPEAVDRDQLRADLDDGLLGLGLAVGVHEVGDGSPSLPASHLLTVHGPDRPDVLADVSWVVAEHDVNITDVASRRLTGEQPVCAVQLEVAAGDDETARALEAALRDAAPDLTVHVEPLDVAAL